MASTLKIRAQTRPAFDAMLGHYIRDGEPFNGNAPGGLSSDFHCPEEGRHEEQMQSQLNPVIVFRADLGQGDIS